MKLVHEAAAPAAHSPAALVHPFANTQRILGEGAAIVCVLDAPNARQRCIVAAQGKFFLAEVQNCTALQIGPAINLEDAANFASSILLGSQRASTSPDALRTMAIGFLSALAYIGDSAAFCGGASAAHTAAAPAGAGAKSAPEAPMHGGAA